MAVAAQVASILADGYRLDGRSGAFPTHQPPASQPWASGFPLIINVVAGTLSITACLWQLSRLRWVRKQLWQCLFLQQVCHLACADILYTVSSSALGLFYASAKHSKVGPVFCPVVFPLVELGRVVSVLIEAHIALALACGSIEWFRLHRILGKLLPGIWVIGVGVSAAELATGRGLPYSAEQGICTTNSNMPIQILFWVLVISFITSCLAHLLTWVYFMCSGKPMQRAVWRRMLLYPVNFLVSYSLVLYVIVANKYSSSGVDASVDSWFIVAAQCLELINGFINVVTYNMQGVYAHRLLLKNGFGLGICAWDSDYDPASLAHAATQAPTSWAVSPPVARQHTPPSQPNGTGSVGCSEPDTRKQGNWLSDSRLDAARLRLSRIFEAMKRLDDESDAMERLWDSLCKVGTAQQAMSEAMGLCALRREAFERSAEWNLQWKELSDELEMSLKNLQKVGGAVLDEYLKKSEVSEALSCASRQEERTVSMVTIPESEAAVPHRNIIRALLEFCPAPRRPRNRSHRSLFDSQGPALTSSETNLLSVLSYLEGADMLRTFMPRTGQTFSFLPVSVRSDTDLYSTDATTHAIDEIGRGRTLSAQSLTAQSLALLGVPTDVDGAWRCATQAPILLEHVFDFDAKVGRGAFGEVFKVRACLDIGSIQKDRHYALKVLNQKVFEDDCISKYAYQERDVMKEARHPCLVRLVSALQVQQPVGKWILVMEYCKGGSLRTKLQKMYYKPESLDPSWHGTAIRYCAEILLGVEYLHSNHIVHRDLKPDNVVLTDVDHCKIVDFGVARVLGQEVGGTMTKANSWKLGSSVLDTPAAPHATNWVGTGVYTAPEVQDGRYDSAVDIFSWGVMVFETLAVTDPEPKTAPGNTHDFMPFFTHHLEQFDVATTALPLLEKTTNTSPQMRGTATELKDDAFFGGISWDDLLRACSEGR